MVELIVVMILIGILGAVGAARFYNRGTFDASAFANQTAAALRFAQKVAIAQNRSVSARFDGTSVSLCFDTGCTAKVTAPFSVKTDSTYCTSATWYCVRSPTNVSYTTSLGSVSGNAPGYITFDALGRPYSGGAALATVTTLTVNGGPGNTKIVSVEPETGYVH
jgi:MSHA pilin protein MshC